MDKNSLEKLNCPVCYSKFFDDEDIVFCPECGAPHHRDCYISIGHCKFEEFHGTEKEWKPQEFEKNDDKQNSNNTEESVKSCEYCNSKISGDALFCPKCGNPVNNQSRGTNPYSRQNQTGYGQFMTYDPLGGIPPDEDLGGASAIDCATYLKTNTATLIPKFSQMQKRKKKTSWNWFSFLIPEYYFLYRKCYWFAALSISAYTIFYILQLPTINWITNIPGFVDITTYDQLAALIMKNIDQLSTRNIILAFVGIVILLISKIFFGILGDHIVKSSCIKKIADYKKDERFEDYHEAIAIKGGISVFAPMAGYMIIQIITVILQQMMFSGLFL